MWIFYSGCRCRFWCLREECNIWFHRSPQYIISSLVHCISNLFLLSHLLVALVDTSSSCASLAGLIRCHLRNVINNIFSAYFYWKSLSFRKIFSEFDIINFFFLLTICIIHQISLKPIPPFHGLRANDIIILWWFIY